MKKRVGFRGGFAAMGVSVFFINHVTVTFTRTPHKMEKVPTHFPPH
jgi:hypothetical protein